MKTNATMMDSSFTVNFSKLLKDPILQNTCDQQL